MAAILGTPVAFIHVSDRQRALDFYGQALGLAVRSSDPFGDFLEAGEALIRLTALPDFKAGAHPVFGWNVADIEAAVRTLAGRGVVFTIYEGFGQDALGIWTAPDGKAKVAWFADPDGNVLSLSQA
ncbi:MULTISPECIES: VOC family protein [unclassified Caulobacter]|uniref:VOC family protein n=1 Tax=unclassified Caulobacter TaxID=2648921 RepID=UPI0018EE9306|nr:MULTISPECIES: VOC family protein [unclassified Caulobacter]